MSKESPETVGVCEEQERESFEEAAFLQYFLSNIEKTNDPIANTLQIYFQPKTYIMDKATFIEKLDNGSYKDNALNSAWWAWKKRAEISQKTIERYNKLKSIFVKVSDIQWDAPRFVVGKDFDKAVDGIKI